MEPQLETSLRTQRDTFLFVNKVLFVDSSSWGHTNMRWWCVCASWGRWADVTQRVFMFDQICQKQHKRSTNHLSCSCLCCCKQDGGCRGTSGVCLPQDQLLPLLLFHQRLKRPSAFQLVHTSVWFLVYLFVFFCLFSLFSCLIVFLFPLCLFSCLSVCFLFICFLLCFLVYLFVFFCLFSCLSVYFRFVFFFSSLFVFCLFVFFFVCFLVSCLCRQHPPL